MEHLKRGRFLGMWGPEKVWIFQGGWMPEMFVVGGSWLGKYFKMPSVVWAHGGGW